VTNPLALMQITQAFQPKVDQSQVVGSPNPMQMQQQEQQMGPGLFSHMEQPPQTIGAFANPSNNPQLFQANRDLVGAARAYQDAATPVTTGLGRLGVLEGIARRFTSKDERDAYRAAVDKAQESSFMAQQQAAQALASDIYQMAVPLVGPAQATAMADRALVDKTFGTQAQKALLDEQRKLREESRSDARTTQEERERALAYQALGLPEELAATFGANEDLKPEDVMGFIHERQKYQKEQQEKQWQMEMGMNREKASMLNSIRQIERSLRQVSPWSTGLASLTKIIPGTPAYTMAQMLMTQQANVAFEELQNMRTDPRNQTGGALGNVSNREVELLYSSKTALDSGLPGDELTASLNDILMAYDIALYGMREENNFFNAVKAGEMNEAEAAAILEQNAYDYSNKKMMHRRAADKGGKTFTVAQQEKALDLVKNGEDSLENFEAVFGWRPAVVGDRW